MYADRQIDERELKICERSMNAQNCPVSRLLRITLDGMDQAKFRIPRNLASSKQFEDLWRPQIGCIGSIVPGCIEAYFFLDADMPKNANTNMTVMSRMLKLCKEHCDEQCLDLPQHWSVKAALLILSCSFFCLC